MNRIIFLAALVSLASTEVPDAMLCGEVFLLMEETNELMNIEPSEDPDQHPLVDAILKKWDSKTLVLQLVIRIKSIVITG